MARQSVQQITNKRKGIADVIFLLDSSGSMQGCFNGIVQHIQSFVEGVQGDQSVKVDWRLGFLVADENTFIKKKFSTDHKEFVDALSSVRCRNNNEFTLPALDFAADFEWRDHSHKIIVLFTDESIRGGYNPEYQLSKLDELIDKLIALHVKLIIKAVQCPVLDKISKSLPRAEYEVIPDDSGFGGSDFSVLMYHIGKTVSTASTGQQAGGGHGVIRDLYGIVESGTPIVREV